jgi:hypothetical protein
MAFAKVSCDLNFQFTREEVSKRFGRGASRALLVQALRQKK